MLCDLFHYFRRPSESVSVHPVYGTPGRAFLEGGGGSKTSGCVCGFWSDTPLDNSERKKKTQRRGSVQSACSPEPKLKLIWSLRWLRLPNPRFSIPLSIFPLSLPLCVLVLSFLVVLGLSIYPFPFCFAISVYVASSRHVLSKCFLSFLSLLPVRTGKMMPAAVPDWNCHQRSPSCRTQTQNLAAAAPASCLFGKRDEGVGGVSGIVCVSICTYTYIALSIPPPLSILLHLFANFPALWLSPHKQ